MFRSAVLHALFCVNACISTAIASEAPQEIVPGGVVVDMNQRPIPEAEVTLHRWDGVMSPALQETKTDAEGHFEFPPRIEDAYYYVVIRKSSFAPIGQIISPEGPIKSVLRPAVSAWIDVQSADGKRLEGARITNISIRSEGNTGIYFWRGMEHLAGLKFGPSDSDGRLNLPPLPQDSIVDIRIDHPQWAQTILSNVKVVEGHLNTAKMPAGTMTTFEFVADPRTPMTLDGLNCLTMLHSKSSDSSASLNRVPMPITGDQIRFCAHPVTYDVALLKAEGVVITPVFDHLTIPRGVAHKVRFLVRKNAEVTGRVLHSNGTPHKGVRVYGEIENLSPDGSVAGAKEWTYVGNDETNEEGRFKFAVAAGRCKIHVQPEGYVANSDMAELDVILDGPNETPTFTTEELAPVRGQVVDANGQAVPGAIVRVRHPSVYNQPSVTDASGNFEIELRSIPTDIDTQQRQYELDVVAFVADQPLMGVARIDLRKVDTAKNVRVELRSDPSSDALLAMEDNQWFRNRRLKTIAEREEKFPAGQRGQQAPELNGVAWFNTDAKSLKDFRGRYVLLDFWFTGCGPCHGDFPSVKLIHEHFEKHGVTVIGVHDNSSNPEAVREHCEKIGLNFPTVVDHSDGRILEAYRKLGVRSFPSYILIDPDGKILENDRETDGPSLRGFKIEVVRKYLLERAK